MGTMRYKPSDKVRIKSLDWYNENKDEYGNIDISHDFTFYADRSKYCGKVFTIDVVFDNCYTVKEDNHEYYWADEMIEGLVERNGKTYPYKIGDRVVLKGNNRCATITDLKYNSWGNLSYYIKIDNDKDISTDYPTELLLPYDNKVEGLVEEEIKSEPKFKVGDKITNGKVTLTILTLVSDRYVVEDTFGECGTIYFNYQDGWKIVEEEVERLTGNLSNSWVNEFNLPEGYIFKDENGNIVNATKIVLEKKKKEYPKTYEECEKVLRYDSHRLDNMGVTVRGYKWELIRAFQILLICRDAYWKIYGEEMGLGKPWEPDWSIYEHKFCLGTDKDKVIEECVTTGNRILAFPTEEMRDAFKENFDPDIEKCKEFL